MPVIVNELEVVLAPPQGSGNPDPDLAPPTPGAAPQLTPFEIAALLERRSRQQVRLFAH